MATLIIQDSFDPYYAGRRTWVASSRARTRQGEQGKVAQEPGEREGEYPREDHPDDEARH